MRLESAPLLYLRSEMSVGGVGTMIYIDDLPDELLLKVFSYLPVRDLVRISSVCHRWNRVAGDQWLWKHVDLTECSMQPRIMWHLLCRYMAPHLQSLCLRGYLYTGQPTQQLSRSLMHGLSIKCPKLWRLSLHLTDLRYLPLSSLPSTLRILELHHCKFTEDWLVAEGRMHLPPLESLELQYVPFFSDQQLKELGRLFSLRRLVLVSACRLTELGVDAGFRELRGLQHLRLLDYFLSTDTVLAILVQHLTGLLSLCVSIHRLPTIGLKHLSALPDLESLTLVGPVLSGQILNPSELLAAFIAMPKLRTLKILGVDWADNQEEAMKVLFKGLPRCKVVLSSYFNDSWM